MTKSTMHDDDKRTLESNNLRTGGSGNREVMMMVKQKYKSENRYAEDVVEEICGDDKTITIKCNDKRKI